MVIILLQWVRQSTFIEENDSNFIWFVKQELARKLVIIVWEVDACLYSQWFVGEKNVMGNSLPRDCIGFLPSAHEFLFKKYAHEQEFPKQLTIRPLPKEIISFVGSILQLLPV